MLVGLFLSVSVSNCGGGGSGSSSDPGQPPVGVPAHRIEYGYYLTGGNQASETYGNVTFAFLGGPITSEAELLDQAATYSNLGVRKFVVNLIGIGPDAAKGVLERLAPFGEVIAIYPVDEPNVNGCDKTNMARYRKLGYPMFTIMGPARFGWLCAEYFDWVGVDDYDKGTGVLSDITAFGRANPNIRLVVVPGGASPWAQDPRPYYDYAKSNVQVVAVVPFLWHSFPKAPLGIDKNGMAQTYTNLGSEIKLNNDGTS